MTADRTANAWDWGDHNLAPQRRQPAPDLTAEQRAIVDRFEAAVEPEEIRVERVAFALHDADCDVRTPLWPDVPWAVQEDYRRLSRVAIAALDAP